MKKIYKFGSEKTYFSCLDVHESSIAYDFDQDIEDAVHSNFARNPGDTVLNRYKIINVLQENTFGFIYLVEKVNKNTKYIIKEFFPHEYVTRNDQGEMILNTPLDIDSLIRFNYMQSFFMGEANNLEKISIKPHSNIIKIASVEKNKNNTSYIIYPYDEGMTLQRYMEIKSRMGKAQLENNEIDKILKPLLEAVEHLHTLNIYHLNIKPENILIKKDGSLLLVGFEASTFFKDEDSRISCTAYTEKYASPEQIDGSKFSLLGKETDIYHIGFLIYRLIIGTCPPSAKDRIRCKNKDIPYDPYSSVQEKTNILNKYDGQLLFSVDKSLMYDAKDRFKNISSFKRALYGTLEVETNKNTKNINTQKKYIVYFLLLLVSAYLLFIGINKIGSEKIVAKNTIDSEKNKNIRSPDEIKNENLDKSNNDIDEEAVYKKQIELEETVKKEQEKIEEEKARLTEIEKKKEEQKRLDEEASYKRQLEQVKIEEEKARLTEIEKKKEEQKRLDEEAVYRKQIELEETVKKEQEKIEEEKARLAEIEKKKKINKRKINVRKTLNKRKQRVIRKKKIKKNTPMKREKPARKNSSGLVWHCKAIGGNVRSSARNGDKARAKSIALSQCRRKSGSQKHCRILNCFLLR